MKFKKPTYKELANELGVTDNAVKQYHKRRRELMLKGLFFEKRYVVDRKTKEITDKAKVIPKTADILINTKQIKENK